MANSGKGAGPAEGITYGSSEIARLRNGATLPRQAMRGTGVIKKTISMKESNKLYRAEHDAIAIKVIIFVLLTVVLAYLSLCFMGAAGQYYVYSGAYVNYTPVQVAHVLYEHAYNAIAVMTHWFSAHTNEWILENVPGYWSIVKRAGVVGITLICAFLLSISGMLYQNAFKNPIAGPGMLGVSSGVNLGLMILVALYSTDAAAHVGTRYALCYGLGGAILLFVIVAGRKLSGKGKPFDIVTMMLAGSMLSQFLGFITMYVTLFVMDEEDYLVFYTISQQLTVNTSLISWVALGVVMLLSVVPIIFLRYKMNALALEPEEARLLGLDYGKIRAIALICGAIMILAAQIHVGMVSLVSLIVPFLSRSLFGCEFNKQLIGNIVIGMPLLLVCRDITDIIPFVADGLSIGSVASIVMLPLFVVVMAKQMRGWE